MSTIQPPTFLQKALAWSVHTFTASGIAVGFLALLAINQQDWRSAMLWLIVALIIDGIDGTFARMFKVKEVLPKMSGKNIDYVVDFATYVIIPTYFFYEANLVPESWRLICAMIMLLSSAVYYGMEGMVSEDKYFIGFPCLWNMVVFYMIFVFQFPELLNVFWVIFFAILHFVPIKFVYPSQATQFRGFIIGLTIVFIASLGLILFFYPEKNTWLTAVALGTVAGYAGLAIYNTWIQKT